MTEWMKYPDLDPYRRLRNDGRELLGEEIWFTEKRDGENVSVWRHRSRTRVSSHNMEKAGADIVARLKQTGEYVKAVDLLAEESKQYGHNLILYGELLKTVSPTRIEPRRKHTHWIMFDIYDADAKRFLPYNRVYQYGYQWKIPVVNLVSTHKPSTLDDLEAAVQQLLKYCKRHRREGVVGKVYHPAHPEKGQILFKQRIDLPKKLVKLSEPDATRPAYPPMPEDKVLRAMQHAFGEVGEEKWRDKRIAMPIFARHVATEAREHNYLAPNNIYEYYVNTPVDKIKSG